MRYDYNNVPSNKVVWACAYTTNNTEKSMAKKCKPVKGMVESGDWNNYFREFKKNGTLKSSYVNASAREYADTKEECIDIYNENVEKQIEVLMELAKKCKEDFIGVE